MLPQYNEPLSDEELAELDAFLLAGSENEDCLTIDEAHGYITSLVVSHTAMVQEEWLSSILGEVSFADEAEADKVPELLLRMTHEIVAALEARELFEPMVIEEELDDEVFEIYEGWCFGFMLGVADQQVRWEGIPKAEQDLLAPIATLALLHSDEVEQMDDEEYAGWVELIPGAVAGLYSHWSE
jgi:uncharacterized protein